jgi:hypothetical protein
MNGLNPWIKGFWLGAGAFWLAGPIAYGIMGDGSSQTAFNLACAAAIATWIGSAFSLEQEQAKFEGRLTNRVRLYRSKEMEDVFQTIQKTMATAWKGTSYWELRAHDLSTGYLLYTYCWRENWDPIDQGRTLYHANLVVKCQDLSNMEGYATLVSYSFDGNPAWRDRQPFYDAVHTVMGLLDSALPDHEVIKADPETAVRQKPVDREMQQV